MIYNHRSNTKPATFVTGFVLLAEDMGLDRPLRLTACVLLSRRPSADAFEPEPAGRSTGPSSYASALSGPSPILPLSEMKRDG